MGDTGSASQFIDVGSEPQSTDLQVEKVHGIGSKDSGTPRILVVDDEEATMGFLERVMRPVTRADFRGTTDPGTIVALLLRFPPDLILLDLCIPNAEGLALLHMVRARIPVGVYLPIVALTNETSPEAKCRILANGVTDVLTKPFDPAEVQVRITLLLRRRARYLEGRARRANPGTGIGRCPR
jgi:DNA-binding response OmpR family regulator